MLKILRFLGIFILIAGGVAAMNWWTPQIIDDGVHLVPNMTLTDPSKVLPGLGEDGILTIIENEAIALEHTPMVDEGIVFLPVSFVQSHFNDEFYWDSAEKILTYTTVNDVIRMRTDDLTYYVNDEPLTLQIPIRELVEGVPYMPVELVKKFSNHEFTYNDGLETLVIEDLSLDGTYQSVVSTDHFDYGVVRMWKDNLSPVVSKPAAGELLKIYGGDDLWAYVRTGDGRMGYIEKDSLGEQFVELGHEVLPASYNYDTRMTFDGGLNLAWHQVTNSKANSGLADKLKGVHGLDVISPTWFHIENAEGDVQNIASLDYVRECHRQGIQVWALFSNQFDKTLTHETLTSTTARQNLIRQLLALSNLYELDGINVDFENVGKDTGEAYVQFMKELSAYLKQQDLVVSVDMYVPSSWTAHYGRTEVGEVVDYVMIMAYDEHWSTSPESGSVASIDFVRKGIVNTLKEVPKEKTVLGLPYYTRIWKEEVVDGEIKVSSKAYSMNKAYEIMKDEGVTLQWLDDGIRQYYGEYEEDGITYKLWHEEERSIEEKVKLMEQYDLAGVAGWKIGLEKDQIWHVLDAYLK